MNKWLQHIQKIYKVRRDQRYLEDVMRHSTVPVPSKELRTRLMVDANSVSCQTTPRSRYLSAAWMAPAAVLIILVGIWAVRMHQPNVGLTRTSTSERRGESHPTKLSSTNPYGKILHRPASKTESVMQTVKHQRVSSPKPEHSATPVVRYASATQLRVGLQKATTPFSIQNAPGGTSRFTRSLSINDENRVSVLNQVTGLSESRLTDISVSVSHAQESDDSYAYASAWNTDDQGQRVKTEWTLISNPQAQRTQEDVSLSGLFEQTQSLTVTIEISPRNAKPLTGGKI